MIRRRMAGSFCEAGKPRASGDDPPGAAIAAINGEVNPARAGMIPPGPIWSRGYFGNPRASGDDPDLTLPCGSVLR